MAALLSYDGTLWETAGKWESDFATGTSMVWEKLHGWLDTFLYMLPNLLIALIVFVIFMMLSYFIQRYAYKGLDRISPKSTVINQTVAGFVRVFIILIGLSITLGILKLDKAVASLLAGAGLMGLALGFAFQDIIINFISSMIIAMKTPFQIGDLIETNGTLGMVKSMNFRSTTLENTTGQWIILANRSILENPMINYTRTGRRRVDLVVGVSYSEDLRRVEQVVLAAIKEVSTIEAELPMEVFFESFGDSSINFVVRFWIKFRRQMQYMQARSEAIILIHEAFALNNITIPFPIRTMDFGIKGGEKLSDMLKMETKPKQEST